MHLHADSVDMVWRRLIRAVSGGFLDRRPHLDRYAKAGNCSDQRCAGRSASTRTNPRNCCLSTAELNVRIHSPPAVSRQTIGSSAAEPHLPFVMSQPSSKTSILIAFGLVLRERSGPLTRRDRGFESGFLQPAPPAILKQPRIGWLHTHR